jgi:hypothetical protein
VIALTSLRCTPRSFAALPNGPKGQLEKLNSDTHPDRDMLKPDFAARGINPVAVEDYLNLLDQQCAIMKRDIPKALAVN